MESIKRKLKLAFHIIVSITGTRFLNLGKSKEAIFARKAILNNVLNFLIKRCINDINKYHLKKHDVYDDVRFISFSQGEICLSINVK